MPDDKIFQSGLSPKVGKNPDNSESDTVYDLFQRGDLPGRKVGRKWLTTKTAVLRWLEQSTKQSTEAQEEAALARAIENGDRKVLVAAMNTGKARLRRKRQHTAQ